MRVDRLVSMANDIGAFFNGETDKQVAASNVANHLKRYWDPRMRRQIIQHYKEGGAGLDPVVRTAISLLSSNN
jgi:formate dehydrogenase subunit delta